MTMRASQQPSLTAALPDPTYRQLQMLRRQIRRRTSITLLEQVACEVGGTVYADFLMQLWEFTTYIRRGRIAGLPSESTVHEHPAAPSRHVGHRC